MISGSTVQVNVLGNVLVKSILNAVFSKYSQQ